MRVKSVSGSKLKNHLTMQLYKAGGFLCEDFTCFGIALKHVDYFQGICFVIGIEF